MTAGIKDGIRGVGGFDAGVSHAGGEDVSIGLDEKIGCADPVAIGRDRFPLTAEAGIGRAVGVEADEIDVEYIGAKPEVGEPMIELPANDNLAVGLESEIAGLLAR